MNSIRGTWWSITAFNEEADMLEACRKGELSYPEYVKSCYGGLEECPTTKKVHFQAGLNTDQIRVSQLKKWLPTAHIEKARNKDALKQYAMKEETAVGLKSAVNNFEYQPVGEVVKELVVFRYNVMGVKSPPSDVASKNEYLALIRYYMVYDEVKGMKKAGILSDPKTYRCYSMFAKPIFDNYVASLQYSGEYYNEESDDEVSLERSA